MQEITTLAGRPFNLNSPKQLGEILFDELKLAGDEEDRYHADSLDRDRGARSLACTDVRRRSSTTARCTKLKSTYIDALPLAVDPVTRRVHTHFGQLRAATGRLNSDNPNLQNIPIRSEQGREIRRAFVARA